MNWLKPMLLMVVLGAILYGVYVVLNKGPAPEPPPGITKDWANPPNIQLGIVDDNAPGPGAPPAPQFGPAAGVGASPSMGPAPSFGAPPPATPNSAQNSWPSNGPIQSGALPTTNSVATGPAATAPATPGATTSGTPGSVAPAPGDATTASPAGSGFRPDGTPNSAPVSRGADIVAVARANGMDAPPSNFASPPLQPTESFATAAAAVKVQLADGKLAEALRAMTKWYDNPKLTADESRQLSDLLSQLAGTVVYSRQHLLEPAYIVRSGDTLTRVASQYNVPEELLAKINGIADRDHLTPGSELKVLRGPFEARVNLERRELTLIVEGCYAGRFGLVGVGDLAKRDLGQSADGTFTVGGKNPKVANAATAPIHHWVALTPASVASMAPNPSGATADSVCIVGTDDPVSVHPHGLNLGGRDAEDVYDILSIGSRVVVRR